MFRNSYDTDVITWSPQGRLHQVCLFARRERRERERDEGGIGDRIDRNSSFFSRALSVSLSHSTTRSVQTGRIRHGGREAGQRRRGAQGAFEEEERDPPPLAFPFAGMESIARCFPSSTSALFFSPPHSHDADCALSVPPSLLSPPPKTQTQKHKQTCLQSSTHCVLAALKRAPSELASHQPKVFKVDDHLGVAVSGLVSDGRSLLRSMRSQCASHRFVYECGLAPGRLVRALADRAQVATQRSWKRPLGVGLLVAGWCEQSRKPTLHYLCPSGNAHSYRATAIGARAQAARTLLEREVEGYGAAGSADELVRSGLRALAATLAEGELDGRNATVAVVGEGTPFTVLEGEDLLPFLEAIAAEGTGAEGAGAGAGAAGEAPVEATEGGEGGGGGGDEPPPPPAPMDT